MAVMFWKEWKGEAINQKVHKLGEAAMTEAADLLLEDSLQIVPLDKGRLSDSGDTSIESRKDSVTATVFYDTPYARKMHEGIGFKFQHGRRAKYLEAPLKSFAKRWEQYVRDQVKKGF